MKVEWKVCPVGQIAPGAAATASEAVVPGVSSSASPLSPTDLARGVSKGALVQGAPLLSGCCADPVYQLANPEPGHSGLHWPQLPRPRRRLPAVGRRPWPCCVPEWPGSSSARCSPPGRGGWRRARRPRWSPGSRRRYPSKDIASLRALFELAVKPKKRPLETICKLEIRPSWRV